MTITEITNQALALPLREREALARQLWDSVNEEASPELTAEEQALLDEADRRDDELERGVVKPMSYDEVMAALNRVVECD